MAGPHAAIRSREERRKAEGYYVEKKILAVYKASPVVVQKKPGIKKPYYKPTPEQEQQIISLAEQLPPEKQAKYITKPPEQPKGIAETLVSVSYEDIVTGVAGGVLRVFGVEEPEVEKRLATVKPYVTVLQPKLVTGQPMPLVGEPVQTVAGVVASVEAPVYTIGRLIGLETPRPPPTVTGGAISAVFGSPHELEKVKEYGASYASGTVLGDILVSFAIGKGAEKAWALTKKVTPEFIKHPVSQTVKFGRVAKVAHKVKLAVPSYRGSRLDVFLAKHSKWYYKTTRGIAHGEVAIPSITEPISLGQLKASKLAWDLTVAPRTGGVWLGKVAVAPVKTKAMLHLISRSGQVSVGFLRELSYDAEPYWKRGLTPLVSQTQLTRMGIFPHVPKIVSTTGKKGVSMVGYGLVATVPRLVAPQIPTLKEREKETVVPKVWHPTLAYEREKFKPLTLLEPKVKQREKTVPALKLPHFEAVTQASKLKLGSLQVTRQTPTLKVPSILKPPSPVTKTPPPIYPRIPRGGFDFSRGGRGLFGRWFKREHKVASPREVAESFFEMKPRRRKRKRRRVKGGVLLRF